MDVPVAINAITAESVTNAAVSDLTRIAELAPQVSLNKGNSGAGASFMIRGLGSSIGDAGLEQAVAITLDGVPVGRGWVVQSALFDVQQVEVMKGPQALFFGKNSPAGVVSIHTADPSFDFEGYGQVGYEIESRERFVEGAISGPLTETLAVRAAARVSDSDGPFINRSRPLIYSYAGLPNITTGPVDYRAPAQTNLSGRVSLLWKPSEAFRARLSLTGGTYKDNDSSGFMQTYCAPGVTTITTRGIVDPFDDCDLDRNRVRGTYPAELTGNWPDMKSDGRNFTETDTVLGALDLTYEFGNLTLSSTTGYLYLNYVRNAVNDNSSFAWIAGPFYEENKTYTQEVRVESNFDSPLNFMIGGYLEAANFTTGGASDSSTTKVLDVTTGRYFSAERVSVNRNRAVSLFGQLQWEIMPTLELAGGLRFTRETKKAQQQNTYVAPTQVANFVPEGTVLRSAIKDENVSPEVTLTWRPTSDWTVYAGYKTGYLSGGISNPTTLRSIYTADSLIFEPVTAKGGEIGIRGHLFDRKLRMDVTAYRYNYENLQENTYNAQLLTNSIQNVAGARIQGVELNMDWRVTPQLRINNSVGYNRARYTDFPNAPCGQILTGQCATGRVYDVTGNQLFRAPDWSGSAGFSYSDVKLGSWLNLELNGGIRYSSGYFLLENGDPRARQDSWAMFDAGARLYSSDDRWEVALIGRNLTNEYVGSWGTDKTFGNNGTYSIAVMRPRQVVLRLSHRF